MFSQEIGRDSGTTDFLAMPQGAAPSGRVVSPAPDGRINRLEPDEARGKSGSKRHVVVDGEGQSAAN
jgi:hypothetical protein